MVSKGCEKLLVQTV